ncbi:MAG: hypothetical protein FWF76_00400 [Oscillospiraceae bacterium]|nr:hypothetical protein [Oscillospiraceae bacterium]
MNRGMGRKIKRSKSLYKSKKSGLRKTLEILITLAIVVGLGFVGYIVADTIGNLQCSDCEEHPFSCICEPPTPAPDPRPDDQNDNPSDGTEHPNNDPDGTEISGDSDNSDNGQDLIYGSVVYAPANVLSNTAALSTFINTASSNGFDAIVIEMKDEIGRVLYQSGIEIGEPPTLLSNNREIVTGTLSAESIATAISDSGLRPIARINTLRDHTAPQRINDVTYAGWIDGAPGTGRPWANPFREGTREYISKIVSELHDAGFEQVILANTIFPSRSFSGLDISILPSYVTNLDTRYTGLVGFVNAVADANPDTAILLEMTVTCMEGDLPIGTAEILKGDGFSENIVGIAPVFARENFAIELAGLSSTEVSGVVENLLPIIERHAGELAMIPLLDASDISDNDRDTIIEAFIQNSHGDFMLRN